MPMWTAVRAAGPLGLILGLTLLPSEVVAGALPLLRAEWGASATTGGWLVSAYQLGYVLAALVAAVGAARAAPVAYVIAWGAPPPPGRSARLRPRVLRHRPVRLTILAYVGHSWELYVSRGWLASFLAAALVARGVGTVDASA